MKVTADQALLERLVKWAEPFAEKPKSKSAEYLKCLLIEADHQDGTLTVTAENGSGLTTSAITFTHHDDLEVESSGRVLVPADRIRIALSVIDASAPVTLEHIEYETGGGKLQIRAGRSKAGLELVPIASGKALLPSVRKASKNGVTLLAEDFVRGYTVGGAAYATANRGPILEGVHLSVVENGLRFLSNDQARSVYSVVPTIEVDDPGMQILLLPSGTKAVLDYVRQGHAVRVCPSEDSIQDAHLFVLDEADRVLFHLRVPTLSDDPGDYPAKRALDSFEALMVGDVLLEIDKPDLTGLLQKATDMAALDTQATGGEAARRVQVTIDSEHLAVDVPGSADFSRDVPVRSYSGPKITFGLKLGEYGRMITSYPNPDVLRLAVLERDNVPRALGLFTADPTTEWRPGDAGLPADYLAVVPISKGEFI